VFDVSEEHSWRSTYIAHRVAPRDACALVATAIGASSLVLIVISDGRADEIETFSDRVVAK
jgi:hypothetical protein